MKPLKLKPVEKLERDIQGEILRYLRCDPRVAWHHRFNVGAHQVNGTDKKGRPTRRFIRYAFPGCSDILGQLITGHLLAVEVKRPGEEPSPVQAAFLDSVNQAGGLGMVATCIEEVRAELDRFQPLVELPLDLGRMMPVAVTGIDRHSALRALLSRHL